MQFSGFKAQEITKNLREYIKNIDQNTLDLFREEGAIRFESDDEDTFQKEVEIAEENEAMRQENQLQDSQEDSEEEEDETDEDQLDLHELKEAIDKY